MLLCTVRSCHEPLRRDGSRYVCPRGHSFDVARSGYVNLLQPNERRSSHPGDSLEAVQARRRLHDAGLLAPIANAIWSAAAMPPLSLQESVPSPKEHSWRETSSDRLQSGGMAAALQNVLDVGCGDGYWLAGIDARERFGVDISIPAIDLAARRYPDCTWIVANADRFLPFSDGSFDLVLSITARMNAPELRRVLRDDGRLLVAVAAPGDLHELRASLLGDAVEDDRASSALETFASDFVLVERRRASTTARLARAAIRDVMTSSYRAMRTRERERLEALPSCDVTFSRDLLLFAPGSRGTPRDSSA